MHMHIKKLNISTFQMIFDFLKLTKSFKLKKIGRFLIKQCPFTKILLNNPIFFFVPKVLRIRIFIPKNTPSEVKNSKMGLNHIFFGTPCRKSFRVSFLKQGSFFKIRRRNKIFPWLQSYVRGQNRFCGILCACPKLGI